jgi:hypothetical protein
MDIFSARKKGYPLDSSDFIQGPPAPEGGGGAGNVTSPKQQLERQLRSLPHPRISDLLAALALQHPLAGESRRIAQGCRFHRAESGAGDPRRHENPDTRSTLHPASAARRPQMAT